MSFVFESLEGRRLFSVNAAITTLHTDLATVRADDKAIDVTDRTNVDIIGRELINSDELRGATLRAAALVIRVGAREEVTLTGRTNVLIAKINLDVARLNAVANQLTLHPSNTRLQTREADDETKLTDDATSAETVLDDDSTTLSDDTTTNLNALAADQSSDTTLATDVSNFETAQGTDINTYQADVNTAFTTDVSAVVATP